MSDRERERERERETEREREGRDMSDVPGVCMCAIVWQMNLLVKIIRAMSLSCTCML